MIGLQILQLSESLHATIIIYSQLLQCMTRVCLTWPFPISLPCPSCIFPKAQVTYRRWSLTALAELLFNPSDWSIRNRLSIWANTVGLPKTFRIRPQRRAPFPWNHGVVEGAYASKYADSVEIVLSELQAQYEDLLYHVA